MAWLQNKRPASTRYALIEYVRSRSIATTSLILIGSYIFLNIVFGIAHYLLQPFDSIISFIDCQYFSFVTGMTVGYGDIKPITVSGRLLVIVQIILSTTYFAVMIALVGVKFLSPYRTIHFSKQLLYDGQSFHFRIINTHRSLLVNPELRVALVVHCVGNVIAPTFTVAKLDDLHWLDNHDFVVGFSSQRLGIPNIHNEWQSALSYKGNDPSRFKIRISLTGSYGFQQYYQVHSYDASDIREGKCFSPIEYNKEDKRINMNIRFTKFPRFWERFDEIV